MAEVDYTTPFLHLVKTPSSPHKLDIVFVHGVNPTGAATHPYDTWTHQQSRVCWPKDLLGDDIPSAQIFIYGYNSNVRNAELMSEARITHHADNLLMQLSFQRPASRGNTRIVFVGHSLGGLIIKQALLNAQRNRKYESILKATFGLAFFAVPHRGANGVSLGRLAAALTKSISNGRADNEILRSLENNSLFTQEMTREFSQQLEDYQVVSYFEQRRTHLAGGGAATLDMTIVGEQSAVLYLPGSRELQVPVTDADHSSICKISGRGNLYNTVLRSITSHITDTAIDSIQSYIPPPSISPFPGLRPPGTAHSTSSPNSLATIAQSVPVTGALYMPSGISTKDFELAEHKNMGRWGKAIALENSIFQERQKNLGPEHPSTLETAYNLAEAYGQLHCPKDAGPWIEWVLNSSRRVLGNEHQLTLKAESLSSEIMNLSGKTEKAEEICAQVYLRQQDVLGTDHVDTLETQGRLGEICCNLGRKKEGITRLKNWEEAVEKVFGENHLKAHYAGLVLCEAAFPMNFEQFSIAPSLTKRAVATLYQDISTTCSQYHPMAVFCLRLLGGWQANEGQFAEASDTLRRALANAERGLGNEHPETIQATLALGMLYHKQGLLKETAMRLQRYADWISERKGEAHPENLATLEILGLMYVNTKEWTKAQVVYEKLAKAASGVDDKKAHEAESWLVKLRVINGFTNTSSRRGLFNF